MIWWCGFSCGVTAALVVASIVFWVVDESVEIQNFDDTQRSAGCGQSRDEFAALKTLCDSLADEVHRLQADREKFLTEMDTLRRQLGAFNIVLPAPAEGPPPSGWRAVAAGECLQKGDTYSWQTRGYIRPIEGPGGG